MLSKCVENEKNVVFVLKQARTPHLNEFEPAHFNQYCVKSKMVTSTLFMYTYAFECMQYILHVETFIIGTCSKLLCILLYFFGFFSFLITKMFCTRSC